MGDIRQPYCDACGHFVESTQDYEWGEAHLNQARRAPKANICGDCIKIGDAFFASLKHFQKNPPPYRANVPDIDLLPLDKVFYRCENEDCTCVWGGIRGWVLEHVCPVHNQEYLREQREEAASEDQ